MPELPDVELYLAALRRLLGGRVVKNVILRSPFLLRTIQPEIDVVKGAEVLDFSRIGKRIVWHFDDACYVFHLMIAGRFHWRKPERMPTGKNDLMAIWFEHGTMMVTEASSKKRASLHVVSDKSELEQFHRGGLEVLDISCVEFSERIKLENRTLKRALTDPRLFSGIGNAYSDEILLAARLSPMKRTHGLSDKEIDRLFSAVQSTLTNWLELLLKKYEKKTFPERVTAFRPEMLAHGKYDHLCGQCEQTKIQRIRYSENECNYCPRCQTGGKMLADRSLSRLLKDDWPKTIEELEEM
ncbi:MAG: DNA-formamidopyrimidine glycosylase family protein [Planctomycetota bacterium]